MDEVNDKAKYKNILKFIITFKFLNSLELDYLLSAASIVTVDPEEPVVMEGEVSPYFFGILEGTVSVSVQEQSNKDVFVCALGPGDVFGEAGIFISVKRTASVTALSPTTLVRIHRNDMVKLIKSYPEAGNKILLVIIFGLLRKLRMVNQELAYERKSDMDQTDIDALVSNLFSDET